MSQLNCGRGLDRTVLWLRVAIGGLLSLVCVQCAAQEGVSEERKQQMIEEARRRGQPPPGAPGQPPGAATQPGPPGASPEKKEGEKPGEEKKAEEPKDIERGTEPPAPPDKKEFAVVPDDDGRVQFNFRNQPWPDLLRWLAEVSDMSLDWQKLPGDYVNMATTRPFTLVETRDLFNRLLLLRGYTLLEIDDVLMVVQTANINRSLVPYVARENLQQLPPNRFVRTSFPLQSLVAAEIVEELKPIISSNGQLNALSTTNRLEAMDAAAVLQQLDRLLSQEQSDEATEQLAREFPLVHVRAALAKEQLEQFLGLESSAASGGRSGPSGDYMMRQVQQQMEQMQRAMQQRGGNEGGGPAKAAREEGKVYLVANARQNSVIVHAPPDKMAIIAAFINRIDVPNESADDLSMLQTRMKVFRLESLDPEQLMTSLLAIDALEPSTRLEVDAKNNAIIAYASLADQYAISQVIERLDGSAREFEVLQLRRLNAEEVAGTIKFLMGAEEEDDSSNSRRGYYYSYYGRDDSEDKKKDSFRVGANSIDNQLLIWANQNERDEINKLLVKLGEIPPEGGHRSNVRIIEGNRSPETLEYLRQLQEQWSRFSDTPLVLPDAEQFRAKSKPQPSEEPAETPKPEAAEEKTEGEPLKTPVTKSNRSETIYVQTTPSDEQEVEAQAKQPPVVISFDDAGNLIIQSDNVEALNRLESLMMDRPPPQPPFTIFYIKHVRASYMVLNLEDYFKDVEEEDSRSSRRYYYFFEDSSDQKKDDPQLGKQKQLKFVYDDNNNTVIVRNATDQQLELISELIDLWDTPTKVVDQDLRYTELVRVQYSKADTIVAAIKDAYRDLLSSNDKAFQQKGGERGTNGGGGDRDRDEDEEMVSSSGAVNFAFSGKLSLGIDSVTNSVLVSAQGKDLLDLVIKMIKELDEAARPSGNVAVVRLPGSSNSASLQAAVQAIMGVKTLQQPQDQSNAQPQDGGNRDYRRGGEDRGRRDSRDR